MTTITAGFDYAAYPQTAIPACPVCGAANPSTPVIDNHGFSVGTSLCACGFGYLNPQLSADGYASFYEHAYRPLVAAARSKSKLPRRPAEDVELASRDRGECMGAIATSIQPARRVAALCDVGGGIGAVAAGVTLAWPADVVTVIDPNPAELKAAAAWGFRTVCALADERPDIGPQDVILCAQTLDHVMDPLAVLRWMRALLKPGGWMFVDVVDSPRLAALRHGARNWKLDHPCNWSTRSLGAALVATGWKPRRRAAYGQYHHAAWCEGA